MANEFREAAEALWRQEWQKGEGIAPEDCPEFEYDVNLLARAMELAAHATRDHMQADPDVEPCDDLADDKLGPTCLNSVAARVKGRIENEAT